MSIVLKPELVALLELPVPVYLSTTGPDGDPQASLVWCEHREGAVRLFASAASTKVRNVECDPRVVVLIVDPAEAGVPGVPDYARLTGVARRTAFDPTMPDRLAVRYGNPGGYPFELGDDIVGIEIRISRVSGFGRFAPTLGG